MKILPFHFMPKVITSSQNPLVRRVLLLREKSRERRKEQLMVIEGIREITLALSGGYRLETLLHCDAILPRSEFAKLFPPERVPSGVVTLPPEVYNRLAYRKDNGGVIAIAREKSLALSDLRLPGRPLILVLESVEKPGNLGAILRTADAAGLSAVICCDPQTDLFNPNTIRASLGAIFTIQVAIASSAGAISWLRENNIRLFAADTGGTTWYHQAEMTGSAAIILGSEASGLSEIWLSSADQRIKIPMQGEVDSLNVSVSAAILVFEAMRQRGFTYTSHSPVSVQGNL